MADAKLIELVFESEPTTPARYKVAYQSLANKPQQLFNLFLEKEIATTFASGFDLYGKQLAKLLNGFTEYFGTRSGGQHHSRKDGFSQQLLEESLRTFIFSLLANDFPDVASEESMADLVMAVIKLSKSEGALELLGAELGETPWVLSRLVADGRMGRWSRGQPILFRSIVSGDMALGTWATAIANLSEHCIQHFPDTQDIVGWEKMRDLVQSFPCEACRIISSGAATGAPVPRRRHLNPYSIGSNQKTFDSLLGDHLGPWKIILSAQALKDLRESVISGNFDDIQGKLLALASGDWVSRSLRKPRVNGSGYNVPVYQAFCKGGVIILWQVGIAFDERYDQDSQVVKVWAISTYREAGKICEYIIQAQQAYTYAQISACQTSDLETTRHPIFPRFVELDDPPEDLRNQAPAASMCAETQLTAESCRIMIESLPMLGKFYSLTTIVLDNIHPEASTAVFPVDVSRKEVDIINHFKTPAFILGRSGTGKTTCLIYKLASRYLSSKTTDEVPVRQMLLTRSKELARKLKLYTKRLVNTRLGIINADSQGDDGGTAWDDSEEDTTQNLFSLRQEDFPLVCTFNYFLKLLENLIYAGSRRTAAQVDFSTFRIDYWKRFPASLVKRIEVDLAYIDIMGVIKGSASLDSNLEPLSRDAYRGKRWKLAPNFETDSERNMVYSIYELYEEIKRKRGEIDCTDRVIRVCKALNKNPELQQAVGEFLDEVYVDEVQDQRPLEIELLLTLIRNPCGIHFAGDTAQCISKDSVFRFPNAKALFYTRFSSLSSIAGNKSFLVPELLPLSQNFRSHKGILSLASLVMELLYTGFPGLVDRLPPEIGEISGPRPILYIGSGLVDILRGAESSTEEDAETTEFGEERVIIVRDEQIQRELQKKVGDSALVLTILQSKGMEFEDVFLYDFFSSSSYSSNFTILEDLLCEGLRQDEADAANLSRHAVSHIVLCSELKHLYVGVTRARTRLWIIESTEDAVLPVIKLFNKRAQMLFPEKYSEPLLEVLREYELEASELRKRFHSTNKTSQSRWRELAYEFMTNKAYNQASFCFKKAKDEDGETLADAYLAELRGMEYRASGSKKQFVLAFEEACELFRKVSRIAKAVECQEAIGNLIAAAEIWSENCKYQEAAWLFMKAGAPKKAAREYHNLGKHEKALATYFHAGLYNEMAAYLKNFSPKLGVNSRKQHSRLCYLLLVHEKVAPTRRAKIIFSLGSEVEQENTFREFGMMNEVYDLYQKQKRYKEAYEVAVNIGLLEEAVRLAKDHDLPQHVSQNTLAEVVNFTQAEYYLTNKPGSGDPKNKRLIHRRITLSIRDEENILLDEVWKALVSSLNYYLGSGKKPDRSQFQDVRMRGFFDIVVTMKTPEVKYITQDLAKQPLESIGGVVDILQTIILERTLPVPAQMYLGVFEIPNQRGEYISLPWSSFCVGQELKFPLQNIDTKTVREGGCKLILGVVCGALASLEQSSRGYWQNKATHTVFQGRCGGGHGKMTIDQFTANLRALVSLNLLFLKIVGVPSSISDTVNNYRAVITHWVFWQDALVRQMAFVSSYHQDAKVLVETRDALKSVPPGPQRLYGYLQESLWARIQSRVYEDESYLSSLLQQVQLAVFLGTGDRYQATMKYLRPKFWVFRISFDVVTLALDLRTKKNIADFPGPFCNHVHLLLSGLREVQQKTRQMSFYSFSVLSLYEELVTILILLIRPVNFVIPRSWAFLHLLKWTKIYRSISEREMLLYQDLLIKVVINFCESVMHIERIPRKPDTLDRRSLDLVVISVINVGTLNPCPARFSQLWTQAQRVFGLKAAPIRNVPVDQLLSRLVKAFNFYGGKDRIGVVVTDGHNPPTEFAGLPLAENGVTVAAMGIPKPQKRHPARLKPCSEEGKISAAYLITLFWRTNGPQFVERMKAERVRRDRERCEQERREELRRERAHLASWRGLRECHNCCILTEPEYSEVLMY